MEFLNNRIKFRHTPVDKKDVYYAIASMQTRCVIYDIDRNQMHWGIARCSKKDEFNKSTGRKIAYARALHDMNLSKDMRSRMWDNYFFETATKGGRIK